MARMADDMRPNLAAEAIQQEMGALIAIAAGTLPDGTPAPPAVRREAAVTWFALREELKADLPAAIERIVRAAYGLDAFGRPATACGDAQVKARRALIASGRARREDFARLPYPVFLGLQYKKLIAAGYPGIGRIG